MHQDWQEIVQKQLQTSVLRGGRPGFWMTSRVHPLPGWSEQLWLKRDDELGMLGSKWRKIQGLTWAAKDQEADTILAWGGGRSQQLLGLVQLGREIGLDLRLLIKEGSPRLGQGTDLLWSLLVDFDCIEMLSRSDWVKVEELAAQRFAELTASGRRVFLVREGAAQIEALWGALTLPLDIDPRFSRVFIEAGTGLTAQALILGFGLLQRNTVCEVLLCAGDTRSFEENLQRRRQELAAVLKREVPLGPFRCHVPDTARSFGSTNQAVFDEVRRTARETGVLLDPIYGAKLMMKIRRLQSEWSADETILMMHTGGASSLFGFAGDLTKVRS